MAGEAREGRLRLTLADGYAGMGVMVTEEVQPFDVDPAIVGLLDLDRVELPYIDLNGAPLMHSCLRLDGAEYVYQRSFPIQGHSAVMPAAVDELLGQGKQLLVAEHNDRYYLYAASP